MKINFHTQPFVASEPYVMAQICPIGHTATKRYLAKKRNGHNDGKLIASNKGKNIQYSAILHSRRTGNKNYRVFKRLSA